MQTKTLKMRYDNVRQHGDIVIGVNGIEHDDGLRTVLEVLLLSDATANVGDAIPDETTNRRGWWADILEANGFVLGSRIWLLSNAKATQRNRLRARTYATEAWQPLVAIGVALKAEAGVVNLVRDDIIAIEARLLMPENPAPRWRQYWIEVDFATLPGAPVI